MKNLHFVYLLLLTCILSCVASRCAAEEKLTAISNSLPSTSISGYVDTTLSFSNTNASAPGFAGAWIGILTDRATTNRLELYVLVDPVGNFVGRGMNYERTLGSDQFAGTLDKHGQARIGNMRIYFRRHGTATVIGKGATGRYFSAPLLREQIR